MTVSDAEIARINCEHLISTAAPASRPAVRVRPTPRRRQIARGRGRALAARPFSPRHREWWADARRPRTECSMIKEGMVAGGVPAELILEEHRATNTGENVFFACRSSMPRLAETISSVICLGKICTARRYPMTLQRHWPEVEKMLVTVNPYAAPVERWHTDPVFRERVLAEVARSIPTRPRALSTTGHSARHVLIVWSLPLRAAIAEENHHGGASAEPRRLR